MVLSVALGGMIGDQVLYLCGRRFGGKLLRRFSKHQDKIERAQKLIQRHPYLFVIGTRFMYGFRVIGPTLIGASQLPPKIFLPLNILGAFALALIFYHYRLRWWSGDCAVVAQSRPAFEALGLVDSGRGSGGRRALVAETAREEKSRIIRRKNIALDKACVPHPTSGAPCLMRRLCVLSCLPKIFTH